MFQCAVRAISVVGPFTGLPQVIAAWQRPPAAGISLFSWALFLAISVVWFLHAIRARDQALALSNALWIVVDAAVIIGIFVARVNS